MGTPGKTATGTVESLKSAMVNGAYVLRTTLTDFIDGDDFLKGTDGDIHLIGGLRFKSASDPGLLETIDNQVWFSYRKGFSQIDNSTNTPLTYDTGWGCVHRSGQMMLYHVLQKHVRSSVDLMPLFQDVESAPFSIHSITKLGRRQGKAPGQWFAPSTMALVIKAMADNGDGPFASAPLHVEVVEHGAIVVPALLDAARQKPTLLMIPIMVGMHEVNPVYFNTIFACLRSRYCVGVIGGRARYSSYYIGFRGTQLIHLDPHRVQPAFTSPATMGSVSDPKKHSVPITALDPSMLFGFYVRSMEEAQDLLRDLHQANEDGGKYPLFSFTDAGVADYTGNGSRETEMIQRSEPSYAVI